MRSITDKVSGTHLAARALIILLMIVVGLVISGGPLMVGDAEAAVAVRASATATAASGSLSIAMPTGTVANDIMIAVVNNATGVTVTPPTGNGTWASVSAGNGSGSTGTASVRLSIFWKRAASGEAGPYVFTQSSSGTISGSITSFSGCLLTGTPFVAGTAGTGQSTALSAGGVTPTVANSMIAYIGGIATASTFSAVSGTDPTFSTPYAVNFNGNSRAVLLAAGIRSVTTTTGTRTATASVTGRWRAIQLYLTPYVPVSTTVTIANGSDPSSNTSTTALAPGGVATYLDAFTLAVDAGTTTVTSATVTLATGSYTGIGDIRIMNSAGTTTYFSAVTNPASDTITFSGGTGLPVTTSATTFYVRISPRIHTAMPATPGSMYAVTGRVTALVAGSLTIAGTDTSSATIYIDNESPANVTNLAGTQASSHTVLSWNNPVNQDFSNVILLRGTAAVTTAPTEGTSPKVGDLIGTAVVRYVGSGTGKDDLGLTDGVHYYYKMFSRDTKGNYSANGTAFDIIPNPICIRAKPVVIIQPVAQDIVTDGGQIKYIVSITNKDVGCSTGAEIFDVAVTKDTNTTEFLSSTLSVPSVSLQSEGSINIALYARSKSGLSVMGDTAITSVTAVGITRDTTRTCSIDPNGVPAGTLYVCNAQTSNDATTTITRRVPKMHNSTNVQHHDPNNPLAWLPSDKWGSGGWGIPNGQYGEFVCATCHKPRATNIKSVKEAITAPSGSFPSTTGTTVYNTVLEGDRGTAAAPFSSNSVIDATKNWAINQWSKLTVSIISGTGHDQTKKIASNTATELTLSEPWLTLPDNTSVYRINRSGLGEDNPDGLDTGHTASTKVCEVCHSKNKYHNYNTANNKTEADAQGVIKPVLSHNNDKDCITCHGHETGFNALASPCDTCHGYPPPALAVSVNNPNGTGSQTVGMHDFHNTAGAAGRLIVCDTCHANAVGTGFNDNGKITMGFVIYPGKGTDGTGFKGGLYDGQTTAQYDSSELNTTVTNNGEKKCSNVYCHGGTMAPNGGRPWSYWDEPNATACLTCHGASADSPPTKGEHAVHAGVDGNNMDCSDCHLGYKPLTIPSNLSTHDDGEANFKFDTSKTYIGGAAVYVPDPNGLDKNKTATNGAWQLTMPNTPPYTKTYGTCSSVAYCHPGGSPVWGSGALTNGCNTCHSDQGAGAASTHGYTAPHSTKHTQSYLIACESCHSRLTSSGIATKHSTSGPVSETQTAEIAFTDQTGTIQYKNAGSTFSYNNLETSPYGDDTPTLVPPTYAPTGTSAGTDPRNATFSWTAGTCNNIWCHSNANPIGLNAPLYASPTWSGTAGCNACHSAPTDDPRTWSTAHDTHTIALPDGYAFTCNVCHSTSATDNNTILNTTKHTNGLKDVSFNATYGNAGSSYTSPACINTYCHSDGTSLSSGAAATHTAASWTGTMACNSCHGGPSDTTGKPLYTNGTPKANSHSVHGMTCDACHDTVTSDGATITNPALHVNKAYNVVGPDDGAVASQLTYVFNTSGGSCSTTYCHSTVQAVGGNGAPAHYDTPQWGNAASAACASKCHNYGGTIATAGHSDHVTWAGANGCNACHITGGETVNVNHANGVIDMSFQWGGTYSQGNNIPQTGGYGTCSTYCHSNAQGPDGLSAPTYSVTPPTWGGGAVSSGSGDTCVSQCHATKANLISGTHGAHVKSTEANVACSNCHYGSVSGSPLHTNHVIEVNFSGTYAGNTVSGTYGDPAGQPQNGFSTCSVSCHAGYPNCTWGGASGNCGMTCNSCHAYIPDPSDGKVYSWGGPEARGAHTKHVNHLLTLTGLTLDAANDSFGDAKYQLICGVCHDATQGATHHDTTRTIKMPASYQFGASPPVYNGVPGTSSAASPKTCSNVSCHYTTTPVWSAY